MITSLYVGILGLIYFKISLDTIKGRRSSKISLGAGENNQILHLVSAHNNFSSYAPLFIICLFLLESQGFNSMVLHLISIGFVVGRLLHYLSMKDKEMDFKLRVLGMQLTLWPLIIFFVLNISLYVKKFF